MSAPVSLFEFKGFLNHLFPNGSTLHGCVVVSVKAMEQFLRRHTLDQEKLCESLTDYKLTPMHVAALTGDVKRVEALMKAGAGESLIKTDYAGNCPIHLAAIRDDACMVQKLTLAAQKANKQFADLRNHHLGTVTTLGKIMKSPQPDAKAVVAKFKEESSKLVAITAEAYQKLTKSIYCDYVHSSAYLLCKEWLEKKPKQEPFFFQMLWQRYLAAPPKIYLEAQLHVGLGVSAEETILQNALVIPWGGEWIDLRNAPPSSERKLGNIESMAKGNPASLINDGFPNTFAAKIPLEGCPESGAVFALRPIAAGEKLTINYQTHSCKFDRYAFVVEDWERSFNRQGLSEIYEKISAFHAKRKTLADPFQYNAAEIFKLTQWVCEPLYILETPRALVHLAARNLVTPEEIQIMEKIEGCYRRPGTIPSDEMIVGFRRMLKELLQTLSQSSDPDFRTGVLEVLDRLFAQHRVVIGMILFPIIQKRLTLNLFKNDISEFSAMAAAFIMAAKRFDRFLDLAPNLVDEAKKEAARLEMRQICQHLGGFEASDFVLMTTLIHSPSITNACLNYVLVDLKR